MAQLAYLSKTTEEVSTIGGVGDFSATLAPLLVSESLAAQYDTEEMQEAGWVVTRQAEEVPPPPPHTTPPPPDEALAAPPPSEEE